jgi:hypothetical protein
MRKTIHIALKASILVLGAADASAMGGGNLSPEASPYALFRQPFSGEPPSTEGRSADIGEASHSPNWNLTGNHKRRGAKHARQQDAFPER